MKRVHPSHGVAGIKSFILPYYFNVRYFFGGYKRVFEFTISKLRMMKWEKIGVILSHKKIYVQDSDRNF